MLVKDIVLWFLLNLALHVCGFMIGKTLTPAKGQLLLESIVNLTNSLIEVTPYLNSSIAEIPPNCLHISCQVTCFNGISTEIEMDIFAAAQNYNHSCSHIEELRLYNYIFPEKKLSYGFLGNYSNKVKKLYICSSNIAEIGSGAFAAGIFQEIYLQQLQLTTLEGSVFEKISAAFNTLSIQQREMPIQRVEEGFLENVRSMIKSLTLQAGLKSIINITRTERFLQKLVRVDLSHNDYGRTMEKNTFKRMLMLEWIDLSSSNLEYLPPEIFPRTMSKLEYLNLSHNKLKAISRLMFDSKEIPLALSIYAEDNEWLCTCALQQETRQLLLHIRTPMVCSEPEVYRGLSMFDNKICSANVATSVPSMTTTEESQQFSTKVDEIVHPIYIPEQTTELQINITPSRSSRPAELLPDIARQLECLADSQNHFETKVHFFHWPLVGFNLFKRESCYVDVIVDSSQKPYGPFVLIWFSKAISERYKMNTNYNDYGWGCYENISTVTSVKHLAANTAYTFCVLLPEQLTTSPFNCKSIYVDQNLATNKNSAWLTRDVRVTGLIVLMIGIAMFLFAGILMTYLWLKYKSALAKGDFNSSKRKSMRPPSKEQHEKLVRFGSVTTFSKRRKSADSEVSYDSYINTNVYEVISTFVNMNTKATTGSTIPHTISAEISNQDVNNYYLTPSEFMPRLANRYSSDVLPELPPEGPPSLPSPIKTQDKAENIRIGEVYFLDSHM